MIELDTITENRKIRERYLGTAYQHQGRNGDTYDCWGLIISIYKNYGIELFDIEKYTENDIIEQQLFNKHYSDVWSRVDEPKLLDIVLLNNKNGIPFHAGVYLMNNQFIHATKIGVLVNRITPNIPLNGFYRYDYNKILLVR